MTKFDSVSTLLADYTGRNAKTNSSGTGDTENRGAPTSTLDGIMQKQQPRTAGGAMPATKKRSRRKMSPAGATETCTNSSTTNHEFVYPKGKLETDKEPKLFAPPRGGGVGRKMVSIMTTGRATRRSINRGALLFNQRPGAQGVLSKLLACVCVRS